VDAAILFSDILVVAEAMGITLEMPGGKGILVTNPLKEPEDIRRTLDKDLLNLMNSMKEEDASELVETKLAHVLASVRLIIEKLDGKVPLIGFSAAPWTLFYYMVGGSSKKNQEEGERWLREHPKESKYLLDVLELIVIEYMSAQVRSGVQMLQLFEAMGEFASKGAFRVHALPRMRAIAAELKKRHPEVPLMVFPRGAAYTLARLGEDGLRGEAGFDVLTLDASASWDHIRTEVPPKCLQGAFDPSLLVDGTEAEVVAAAHEMLRRLGDQGLIANLSEGLSGKEKPALVEAFVNAVHSYKAVEVQK
jgi:uroporphyrinogen decarboxylase